MKNNNKTALQVRAEDLSEQFKHNARKPIVIEFAGSPKAGKTSTINQVQSFLKRCGFRVQVVIERASVCPIRDKKHANFNVWTSSTTLAQILEHTQVPPRPHDPEILILDRGIFDSICWLSIMEKLSRIRDSDRQKIEEFLLIDDWRQRVRGVIVMTSNSSDAMKREEGCLPVISSGGSIMNTSVLDAMMEAIQEVSDRLSSKFSIFKVNTSFEQFSTLQKTSEEITSQILEWIDDDMQEEILVCGNNEISPLFSGRMSLGANDALQVVEKFVGDPMFLARSHAESDIGKVQALPIVIVRNKNGDILRLRRKEKDGSNDLHQRIVIWAGGHVRKEDKENGDPILFGAIRELEEELRLAVNPNELALKGAIHANVTEGTRKHVALVYEWRASTDEVEIALSNAEFFERKGNSLSGRFVSVETILAEHQEGKLKEEWSNQIVKNFIVEIAGQAKKDLFD